MCWNGEVFTLDNQMCLYGEIRVEIFSIHKEVKFDSLDYTHNYGKHQEVSRHTKDFHTETFYAKA
jgi:hypothetical protein